MGKEQIRKEMIGKEKIDMLYINVCADDINLGVDVDGTLTKEIIGKDILSLPPKEVEKAMLNCTPKDGIDVLFQNDFAVYIITGRQEKYRGATAGWLDMYGIPYKELNMFPDDFYILNGYSVPKYIELKLDIHIRKNVHFSLDDNEQLINTLNEHGIPACKVEDSFKDAFEKVFELNGGIKNGILERKHGKNIENMQQLQIPKFVAK